jgi:hypothetical protein
MEALFYLLANYILLSSNKEREKFIDQRKGRSIYGHQLFVFNHY